LLIDEIKAIMSHVKWVPCHHGMARFLVVAETLNKQLWTSGIGQEVVPRLGFRFGRQIINMTCSVLRQFYKVLEFYRLFGIA